MDALLSRRENDGKPLSSSFFPMFTVFRTGELDSELWLAFSAPLLADELRSGAAIASGGRCDEPCGVTLVGDEGGCGAGVRAEEIDGDTCVVGVVVGVAVTGGRCDCCE